jgi:hypothetical protein
MQLTVSYFTRAARADALIPRKTIIRAEGGLWVGKGQSKASPRGRMPPMTLGAPMQKLGAGAVTFVCLALCGCAGSPIANEAKARQNYEQSTADYRACLVANPNNVQSCDAKRLIMETDERHWHELSDDVKDRIRSPVGAAAVTIQNNVPAR